MIFSTLSIQNQYHLISLSDLKLFAKNTSLCRDRKLLRSGTIVVQCTQRSLITLHSQVCHEELVNGASPDSTQTGPNGIIPSIGTVYHDTHTLLVSKIFLGSPPSLTPNPNTAKARLANKTKRRPSLNQITEDLRQNSEAETYTSRAKEPRVSTTVSFTASDARMNGMNSLVNRGYIEGLGFETELGLRVFVSPGDVRSETSVEPPLIPSGYLSIVTIEISPNGPT